MVAARSNTSRFHRLPGLARMVTSGAYTDGSKCSGEFVTLFKRKQLTNNRPPFQTRLAAVNSLADDDCSLTMRFGGECSVGPMLSVAFSLETTSAFLQPRQPRRVAFHRVRPRRLRSERPMFGISGKDDF